MGKKQIVQETPCQEWSTLIYQAKRALERLEELQIDYQELREKLPKTLPECENAKAFEAICGADIDGAWSIVDDISWSPSVPDELDDWIKTFEHEEAA